MNQLQTIPSMLQLLDLSLATPDFMVPNQMPSAVILKELLSVVECERIVAECGAVEPHSFHGCNASTRECARPLSDCLKPVLDALLFVNDSFFNFDVYPEEPAAWLQTYGSTQDYKAHTDGAPGQSRKLTAVAMLTDQREYAGGFLVFQVGQTEIAAPSARGTVIVFPAWVSHQVTPIDYGIRQTINLGLWGPPFR